MAQRQVKPGRPNQGKRAPGSKPNSRFSQLRQLISNLKERQKQIDTSLITSFKDLPLSKETLQGLRDCGYKEPTDIQKETLKLALDEQDVLGAAKTGSGKTLAFLIPILEKLYCEQWTRLDGPGALVITPTRELAYQIHDTLKKVGKYHDFSSACVIGGEGLKAQRGHIHKINIIVCTPGRLLQHMNETQFFDCVNLKILVLDEADRCLDMGFQQELDGIIENLPETRQTLLFSATQTKSVKDLVRLSLKDPRYVAVHEHESHATPKALEQHYAVCDLKDKFSIAFSFLKEHRNDKLIFFLASCKEVKYFYEMFKRLIKKKINLLALYGTLHQQRRLSIYETFCKEKAAVLIATDIAARGLDFPEVQWVVQVDCPEDADTYIHRVGRTARFRKGGSSLLLLLPTELPILQDLKEKKVPIEKQVINLAKITKPVKHMNMLVSSNEELKDTAKRAFLSYIKSIYHMKNKKVFDVRALDTDSYAHSLGLVQVPRVRFLDRANKRNAKGTSSSQNGDWDGEDDGGYGGSNEDERTNSARNGYDFHVYESDEDGDDFTKTLKGKGRNSRSISVVEPEPQQLEQLTSTKKSVVVTKAAAARKLLKKIDGKTVSATNTKIIFDDDGDAVVEGVGGKSSKVVVEENENKDVIGGISLDKFHTHLNEVDRTDKQVFHEKVKSKHKEKKRKLKEQEKKKRAEREEQDEFGDSDDSGDEPDLSWLPDPDKVYGKKEEGEENEEFDGGNDSDDIVISDSELLAYRQETTKKTKKRKRKQEDDGKKEASKKKKKQKVKEIGTSLNVNEAEELAMMLLSRSK